MKQFFFVLLYQPLYNLLIYLAWLVPGHSIGWAIIILTILIKIILFPTSLKAVRLQVKNLAIQPKMNKIRSEIKDQKAQTEALMALYKEEGVSPLGSCLPILVQTAVLYVLYRVFDSGLTTANYHDLYSFVPRIADINTNFFGLDLAARSGWSLPIVAGLLQVVLSLMMMPKAVKGEKKSNDPMAMMNKQMIFLLPLITVFFGRAMPAALVLYWVITTIFGIGQQWYVNEEVKILKSKVESEKTNDEGLRTKAETGRVAEKSATPSGSKEDMMTKMMKKRLDRQEKKAGVNVTVRTKKKR